MRIVVLAALAAAAACGRDTPDAGGELHARKVVLEREVESLREITARLERGEPMLPADDVAIGIDDGLLRDIISAQLPFDADIDVYHLKLRDVAVTFRGSPLVRMRGALNHRDYPDYVAEVTVLGALVDIAVDAASSTLTARIAVDHLGIDKAAGFEKYLSGATLDELARTVRQQIGDRLPPVQIPVTVQKTIELPAVTRGPVRIDGARLPLTASVSQVNAVGGRLWIGVHLVPGDVVKTIDAPASRDTLAADAGVTLGGAAVAPAAQAPRAGKGK
jgi:hypothetical protein